MSNCVKCIKILIAIILLLIIPSLFYMHKTNQLLSRQIQKNSNLKQQIMSLDQFKADIKKMSQMNKYYLISDNDIYKTYYEESYTTVIEHVNELYSKNYITLEDKNSLDNSLNDFNIFTLNIKSNSQNFQYTKDKLDELSQIENIIIDKTTNNLYDNIEKSNSEDGNALNIVNTQNNIIEVIGGFFSMVFLSPIYFLGKNITLITDSIKKFLIEHIYKDKITKNTKDIINNSICNDDMVKCINNGIINNLKEEISDKEKLIATLKIINSYSDFMTKEYTASYQILDSIETDILTLKNTLSKYIDKSEIPYDMLNIIENKFLETKFVLERIPNYNDFIIKLTEKY